jgi:DNA-binding XRE family transcriptional regulator
MPHRPPAERGPGERRHAPLLPGFKEMADRRLALARALTARRVELGLTQTDVAARMGTSQSAVARLESGHLDVRLSTIERYAAAVGHVVDWRLDDRG